MFPHEWRLLKRAELQSGPFLSWHRGRDIHTTVFNDCTGLQAIRAHLRNRLCGLLISENPANEVEGRDRDGSPAVLEII